MIGKTGVSILLVLVVISTSAWAQASISVESDSAQQSHAWTYIGIGGAVAITAILLHYDQQIYDEFYKCRSNNEVVRKVSPIVTNLGDGGFSIGLFGGFAGYGLIFKNDKAVEVGKIGIESFLITGITVQLFKHLCGRERPSAATRPGGFWHGPFAYFSKTKSRGKGISSFDAFPSGHTTSAFSAATTISDFYTEPWVSYTCYSLATVVAISRVMESTHWLSDCFIGAIIGHYGTRFVQKLNYGSSGITLLPQADERRYGLLLSIKF